MYQWRMIQQYTIRLTPIFSPISNPLQSKISKNKVSKSKSIANHSLNPYRENCRQITHISKPHVPSTTLSLLPMAPPLVLFPPRLPSSRATPLSSPSRVRDVSAVQTGNLVLAYSASLPPHPPPGPCPSPKLARCSVSAPLITLITKQLSKSLVLSEQRNRPPSSNLGTRTST